jgi:hypothetical protein
VGILVVNRRGPIGQLHATIANLEIPVPRIDMVNDSLEALAIGLQLPGAIDATNGQQLAGSISARHPSNLLRKCTLPFRNIHPLLQTNRQSTIP